MTLFGLIPGAGCDPAYWAPTQRALDALGFDSVAVDLPSSDDGADFNTYADVTVDALAGHADVVLVAHSFGAFTAPLVCARRPVDLLVLLSAMVPQPGESPADWWAATGQEQAQADAAAAAGRPGEESMADVFYHDLTPAQSEQAQLWDRPQSATPFEQTWPMTHWPEVATHVLGFAEDRLFPLPFQRRVAAQRLGLRVTAVPGGHMGMVSRPGPLAAALRSCVGSISTTI
ncbi:alpha/beta hydrolase [Occultella glacieicola]|uniref:Alpha/beta hydrolase n=1 Tax=Occultella glacieicola TaxID=2518684 RepID=A0ABY2E711_9MICO|nr:alpha/beta hydrolase [Occultella glacieicola]TDE95844.1 alpha/beta hydrolase [Occultella glacieicola]